jgi:cytochrome o ubiquinol oxidase subunit 2
LSRLRILCLLPALALLCACHAVVLSPSGDIASQQGHLVILSTVLMLFVVVPVMALTLLFAWRYRENGGARFEPEWNHATHLELLIWGAPLLIIIALGAVTWAGTHLLDPFRPIDRTAPGKAVSAEAHTLKVQVVALDWKWLFIYPDQGIATVNELAAPVDTPIELDITASSVMNSLYIPALAGQVYAMPGMQTQLHAVVNRPGDYEGFSANYSGAGFSGMHFRFHGLSGEDFARWVARVKGAGGSLDRSGYVQLAKPSENEPVHRFAAVDPKLYHAILTLCVEPGPACMDGMDMTTDNLASAPRIAAAPLRGAGLAPPPLTWFGAHTSTASLERRPHP